MVSGEAMATGELEIATLVKNHSQHERALDSYSASEPIWLKELRAGALAQLGKITESQSSAELWRYTSSERFDLEELVSGAAPERAVVLAQVASFKNSTGQAQVSQVPAGVSLQQETPVTAFGKSIVELLLRKSAPYLDFATFDAFSDLWAWYQLAFHSSCVVIHVQANQEVAEPIRLSHILAKGSASIAMPLVIVKLEAGASLTLVDDLEELSCSFISGRLEVVLDPNSKLNYVALQNLPQQAKFLARQRFWLRRDAQLNAFHLGLGAALSRIDLDCCMLEAGSSAHLNSVLFAKGEQVMDLHPTQAHVAPNCYSNLQCNTVVQDEARVSYYGYVRVTEGAQKTDAYQKNKNLLLSSKARVDSVPNLEIKANDVKCSHGSSTSEIGSEDLFYLMSRGLSRADAESLLVEAFFEDLLPRVKNKDIEEYLRSAIYNSLGYTKH